MTKPTSDRTTSRRDLVVTTALACVGGGMALATWPFLAQLWPDRAVPPRETAQVDLASISAGTSRTIRWNSKPVVIRHRSAAELELAAMAGQGQAPAGLHREWLVVIGLCTHLPCVLQELDQASRLRERIGWICPCCASRFDLQGSVIKGPARGALAVPPYTISRDLLVVG